MLFEPHRSLNIGIRPPPMHARLYAPTVGALAVGTLGIAVLSFLELGLVSRHMAVHIAMMNVAAPLLAAGLGTAGWIGRKASSSAAIWSATILQMALLWAWHSPFIQQAMHTSWILALVLHTGLLLAAVGFWGALIAAYDRPWQGILALLMSGKFACLLGALLVFSPHPIIHLPTAEHSAMPGMGTLIDDQHLAGLLMLAACPISYILAAIYWTAQEITSLPRYVSRGQSYRPSVGN
jgi:putative membrane protein